MQAKCALDDEAKGFRIDGLLIEIVGAHPDGLDCVRTILIARDHNHFRIRRQGQDIRQCCEALTGAVCIRRQTQIDGRDGRLVAAHHRNCRIAIASHQHFVAVEAPLELFL